METPATVDDATKARVLTAIRDYVDRDVKIKGAPARFAHTLLELARDHRVREAQGILLPLRLSQQDLANLIGVTRESVNLFTARAAGVSDTLRRGASDAHRSVHLSRLCRLPGSRLPDGRAGGPNSLRHESHDRGPRI